MLGAYALGEAYLGQAEGELPRLRTGRLLVLARIFLDSGTENVASVPVLHPSRYYEARVLNWGSIQRAIPVPAGLPQVGDARIRIADTDFAFRDLFADASPPQTPLERLVEIRITREGEPESWGVVVYTGEIVEFQFGDVYCELAIRDITFSWLDEEWPGTLDSGVYAPTIFGRCIQNSPTGQHGLIPLPHIGFDVTNGDRWILAWHTVNNVVAIHRHNLDGSWEVVDTAEYSITEDDVVLGGIIYTGTYIDFTVQQDEGIEIRADVEGWNIRPTWGSLPMASGLLRNPIDFYINIITTIEGKIGRSINSDTIGIAILRALFPTGSYTPPSAWGLGISYSINDQVNNGGQQFVCVANHTSTFSDEPGSGVLWRIYWQVIEIPVRPYYCDGAVLEPITVRSLLSQFVQSFTLDLFQRVDGSISLAFVGIESIDHQFDETLHILENTFIQRSPQPLNRFKCKMARNYAENSWSIEQLHNNTEDQAKLGRTIPKITASDIEMWWARDRYTAADAVARRAGFMTLASFDQEFGLPLSEIAQLELCDNIALTIRSGLASGGFQQQRCRVDGLILDLDNFEGRVTSRIWIEQELSAPSFSTYELDGTITLTAALDAQLTESI